MEVTIDDNKVIAWKWNQESCQLNEEDPDYEDHGSRLQTNTGGTSEPQISKDLSLEAREVKPGAKTSDETNKEHLTNDFHFKQGHAQSYENIISQQRSSMDTVRKENVVLKQRLEEVSNEISTLQTDLEGERQFTRTTRRQLHDAELKLQFETFIIEEQKRENEMLRRLLQEEQRKNLIQEDLIRELRNQLQNTHLRIETQINDLQFFLKSADR